tara:strand:+ start:218 stop:529 length:312 start_codon:yes stop_codon:yes gene_type:complete
VKEKKRPIPPTECPDGSLLYPNGTKVLVPDFDEINARKEKMKAKQKAGEEKVEMTAKEKRDQALKILKYARAKAELEMSKFSLYNVENTGVSKQPWQSPLTLI